MHLNKKQITAFDHLIAYAFVRIRHIAEESGKTDQEKLEAIYAIADGFHNIPWLIADETIDEQKVIRDMDKLGGYFKQRAVDILSIDTGEA